MPATSGQAPICPQCGEPADRHRELIPVERRIVNRGHDVLTVHGLISEKDYEHPVGQELRCPRGHAFPIPADIELAYA